MRVYFFRHIRSSHLDQYNNVIFLSTCDHRDRNLH